MTKTYRNQRLLVREREPKTLSNISDTNSKTTTTISTDKQTLVNFTFLARRKGLSLRQFLRQIANAEIQKVTERERIENKLVEVGFGGAIQK